MGGTRPSGAKRSVTLATAVHHRLMPTPNAADGTGGPGQQGREGGLNLRTAATLLPTPTTQPTTGNGHARHLGGEVALLPTPMVSDTQAEGPADLARKSTQLRAVERLLPTPAVNDMGAGKTVEDWDAWTDRMKAAHGNGNGHGASLAIEAARLLPTPRATDGEKGGPNQRGSSGDVMLPAAVQPGRWGAYASAVARWEAVTGRTAPSATEPGTKGQPRLSAAFVEWLMGLEPGRVTDVPGVGRNAQLKALGNGVVPQQAALALGVILAEIPTSVLDRLRSAVPA